MNLTKLLRFDISSGISRNLFFVIPALSVPILVVIEVLFATRRPGIQLSFGDFILRAYGGMKPFDVNSGEPFIFPALWMLIFLPLFFALLNYPYNDLQSWGQQVILRTQSRSLWWWSKCGWNILACLIYHGILLGILALGNLYGGGAWSMNLDANLIGKFFQVQSLRGSGSSLPIEFLFLPVLFSVAVCLFQMTLSMFCKPIFCFTIIAALMIASAYVTHPIAIGNFAMLVRSDVVLAKGLSLHNGFLPLAAIIISSIIVGFIRFRRYDIINRED
ncbi:MAG: hypothetical protein FWH04_09835 [Oscillospiraceae bacterium]|nr:hypothetical protein [Oscillospiraceae bacterium]